MLVGKNPHRSLPEFFQKSFDVPIILAESPGFVFKSGKGVSIQLTALRILKSLRRYVESVKTLERLVEETRPDLIINFLEPLTGLYKLQRRDSAPVLSVGHQFMMKHPGRVAMKSMRCQQFLMRQFVKLAGARSTHLALSFCAAEDRPEKNLFICPPLLRKQLFDLKAACAGDFLLAYLLNPGYAQEIIDWHQTHRDVSIHCFYDKTGAPPDDRVDAALTFHALDGEKFLALMSQARAVACTAGFESVCEAAYLGKPVLLIPVENHVEQNMNALEAERLGFGLSDTEFNLSRIASYCASSSVHEQFVKWVNQAEAAFLRVLGRMEEQVNAPRLAR